MKGLHTQGLFESLLTTLTAPDSSHILFSVFSILSHLVLSVHGSPGRRKL